MLPNIQKRKIAVNFLYIVLLSVIFNSLRNIAMSLLNIMITYFVLYL